MKQYGVYLINIDCHFYVGSTTISFHKRWGKHLRDLQANRHVNCHLQRAFNKYHKIRFVVLEICQERSKVLQREQYYLDVLSPDLNICRIAGNTLGVHRTEQQIKNIKNKLKGRKPSKYTIEEMIKVHKGFPLSKKHKEKLSIAMLNSKKLKRRAILQFDINGKFLKEWESAHEIERAFHCSASNIRNCCAGITKKSHGYVWKYKN